MINETFILFIAYGKANYNIWLFHSRILLKLGFVIFLGYKKKNIKFYFNIWLSINILKNIYFVFFILFIYFYIEYMIV